MIVGYDDGSTPITPISAEMNISLPAILDFTIAKKCGDMIGYRMLSEFTELGELMKPWRHEIFSVP
jgi:hypothetical protein